MWSFNKLHGQYNNPLKLTLVFKRDGVHFHISSTTYSTFNTPYMLFYVTYYLVLHGIVPFYYIDKF